MRKRTANIFAAIILIAIIGYEVFGFDFADFFLTMSEYEEVVIRNENDNEFITVNDRRFENKISSVVEKMKSNDCIDEDVKLLYKVTFSKGLRKVELEIYSVGADYISLCRSASEEDELPDMSRILFDCSVTAVYKKKFVFLDQEFYDELERTILAGK